MKNDVDFKENLKEFISKIKNADGIYEFFKMLNYPKDIILDKSYKRKISEFEFRQDVKEKLKQIYLVMNFADNLPVYLAEARDITSAFIRDLAKGFAEKHVSGKFLIILTSDYEKIIFVSPEYEKLGAGKHKIKLSKLTLDKHDIYRTDIDILSSIVFENESSWYDVWRKWKNSFSVEKVTEEFFEDYKKIFFDIRKNIRKQRIETKQAHEFTLQFLNRIMFIYFVAKKKWLNNDPKFMRTLFKEYYVKGRSEGKFNDNSFYEKWLKVIFFEAFNNNFRGNKIFPEEVNSILMNAPYLNGGLFKENDLDRLKIEVKDDLFKEIFNFFEKYNFTIKEYSPLDVEVAVDPQMIGYVYESLANVAENIYEQEEDLRGDWGIFYTPRVEVDFMCRRTLTEYLSKHTDIPKEEIYEFVFDDDKTSVKKKFSQKKYWNKIEEAFESLSVIDPACGSGAFLVGMLNVLSGLYKIVYAGLGRERTDFEIKKRIAGRFLYGVDVMPWAIYAAELRLWLQLIVETEFKIEQLKKEPLLPNLNMNLRVGDSLMQEIGGLSFNLRSNNLKSHLKDRLNRLKKEKQDYFDNRSTGRLGSTENMQKWAEEIRKEEMKLFHEIIDDRIDSRKNNIESMENEIKKNGKQIGLFGAEINVEGDVYLKEKEKIAKKEKEIKEYEEEINRLKKLKMQLDKPEKKPFIWDIDFAEIFGDKGGFDIVIGNPPYVRQEKISPPNKQKDEASSEDRKEYKEKLIKSVQNRFPVVESINRQSDYYIYFYFHGLSLLNENGTFCFITSNSWLDVGYGKDLQEFLLKYAPITAIYDNPKRSFAHADVNTIIALFGAPKFKEEKIIGGVKISNGYTWPMLNHTAKFVMFKKPFEEVLNSKNLIEIENIKAEKRGEGITELVKNVVKTNDYRAFPISQEDLLEDGWEYPEEYKNGRFKAGSYESNKWGVKFLRAPDIFYTILEKGKDKLVELG
ncbi:MAG: Eco57I restriction-modification methylase domain-containing protein [Nanoarchaeota archaeon]|nr:Eco57I restriction-modification methylase domain-containing protein [Nanoarchaeota archaeon]